MLVSWLRRARFAPDLLQIWVLTCASLWFACVAPPASAQATADEWYGWQNLIVDGAGLTLVLTGTAIGQQPRTDSFLSGSIIGTGTLSLVFASPIVHWAHGNVDLGFGSLGARAAHTLFVLYGLLQHAVTCGDLEAEGLPCDAGDDLVVLGVLGGIVVIIVDSALSREPRERPPVRPRLRPSAGFSSGQAWLGLSGDF